MDKGKPHLSRSMPERLPGEDWRLDAKCRGDRPSRWNTDDSIPLPKRQLLAKAQCSGCPVFMDCARDALYHFDFGVIRAGIPLNNEVDKGLMKQYNELRRLVGEPEQAIESRGGKFYVPGHKFGEGRSGRSSARSSDARMDDVGA